MTEEQIVLVKNSWRTFRNIDSGIIGDLFYSKLFIENPKLKRLFPFSMEQQHRKIIDMLSFIISRLDNLEVVTEDIKAMARRHEGYGVKREHYKLVGEALLWTMKHGIGDEWDDKLREAWIACYNMIAKTMISATKTKGVI